VVALAEEDRSEKLPSYAASAAGLLAAMGNEKRLLSLFIMAKGEIRVRDLAFRVGLSQPALSQHLVMLRKFDLVAKRRERNTTFYSCTARALQRIQLWERWVENDMLSDLNP
jgi:ArsR family transcriptional regulator, virulence genes transcriptional regulator